MKKYLFQNKKLLSLNIIFIMILSCMEILKAALFGFVVDSATSLNLDKFILSIQYTLIFIIMLFIISILSGIIYAKLVKKSLIKLKEDILSGILEKDFKVFNSSNSSKYISYLTNDINIINNDFFNNINSLLSYAISFVLALVFLIKINYIYGLSILILSLIPILLSKIFINTLQKYKKLYSDSLKEFTIKIKDIFLGFEVIRNFNLKNIIKKDFNKYNINVENTNYKTKKVECVVTNINDIAGLSIFLINYLIGAYLVVKGNLTIGTMMTAMQLMNYIINPLSSFTTLISRIKSVELIYNELDKNMFNDKLNNNKLISKDNFNDKIQLQNLSFQYTEGSPILKEINFNIEIGKKYALVGESGCGKSTIAKLLLNYYDNYKGNILIDKVELSTIKKTDLNNLISIINQDVFLFNDTIKNNICLYRNYDDSKLNNIIKLSGLEKMINNLPDAVDHLIDENGKNFSGGEKQRIAIARALIRDTPILILDEATGALDNKISFDIENILLNLSNITSITITHKINNEIMNKYNEIIVIRNGVVVETGSYLELLNSKGYFSTLHDTSINTSIIL
ncbi:ABC transporter ATP-binding protein [Clostridium butanoliproducens]|uniref:ABC transporter ATP-binding protein n=2 Tax=Clostridium TaxID=1485 RepID=UPI0024B94D3D|nr:ABC transporter ATP-binding protein [Clostridium butanoliproducens]